MTLIHSVRCNPASERLLSLQDLAQYESDGYVIIRDFLSTSDLVALKDEAEALYRNINLVKFGNLRCRWQKSAVDGGLAFDAFDPIVDLSPSSARFAADERLKEILERIYGETAFLFRDKLIFKEHESEGYPTHQDFISGTQFPASVITVVLAIDPATKDSGCIEVFPGYHRTGYLVEDSGNHRLIDERILNGTMPVPLTLAPGDIALFSCFTPHRSGTNRSHHARRHLYLSYNSASDGHDRRDQHYAEFHKWLKAAHAKAGITSFYL